MRHLLPFIAFFTILSLASCDKVETPVPPPTDLGPCPKCPEVDSSALNEETAKVLVEEFTGHTCAFCPRNTRKLLAMQEVNDDQIVVTSIHAGETFAATEPHYPEDFTTPYGDALHEDYQVVNFGYPSALVMRATYPGLNNTTVFVGHTGGWEDAINERLNKPATVALGIAATYQGDIRKFYIRVSARALSDLNGNHKLVLLCLEDSVIAPQKDQDSSFPDKRVADYAHRHVVRAQVNSGAGAYGETVVSDLLVAGEWIDRTYEFEVPENVVKPENCSFVAFITNGDTREVIQAEESHDVPTVLP